MRDRKVRDRKVRDRKVRDTPETAARRGVRAAVEPARVSGREAG
ncbi:hypothetical protein GCM10025331_23050 [Actinoplanes utahensis]